MQEEAPLPAVILQQGLLDSPSRPGNGHSHSSQKWGRGPGGHLWSGQWAACSPNTWCKPKSSQSEAPKEAWVWQPRMQGQVRIKHLPRAARTGEERAQEARHQEAQVLISSTW